MPGLDKRNPLPNQNWDNVEPELVDFAFVQERSNEPAATHHPYIFAGLRAQLLRERINPLARPLEPGQQPLPRTARKEIILGLRSEVPALHAHLNSLVICFAAPKDRVNGLEEFSHSIISLWPRTVEPTHVTIGTCDEAVRTHCDGHDDLSALFHGSLPLSNVA